MNWNTIEGKWKEVKGQAREKWGKLTDDQLDVIAGRRETLEGHIQQAYGKSKDEAKREVDDFAKQCKC